MSLTVSTFYKFVTIADCESARATIAERACALDLKGTVLIAHEGINATIAGSETVVKMFLEWLRTDPRFADLESKESSATKPPFRRLKIKIKPEIVSFGVPEADPSVEAGTYVEAADWNAVISDPNVIVVDTRNDYEVAIGTFKSARDPGTRMFSDFPAYVEAELAAYKSRKVAMFCTGGIRCEKATAYLITQGFTDVVHLKGGILKYLEDVPADQSLWRGACFVFDSRVALEHGLAESPHGLCGDCGFPIPEPAPARAASDPRGQCASCCAAGARA